MTNGFKIRVNQSGTLNISNREVEVDSSLGAIVLTLPLYVNEGYTLKVIDISGTSGTNSITIQVQGNSTINGGTSIVLNSSYSEATINYDKYTTNHEYSAVIVATGGATPADSYKMIWNFNEQTIPLAGWTQVLGGGGGTVSNIAGEINHNGIFRLSSGSTGNSSGSGTYTAIRLGGTTTTNKPFDCGDRVKMEMMVRFPSFQILTTYSVNYRIGLIGDILADNGCFFAMDTQNFSGQPAGRLHCVNLYPTFNAQTITTSINIVAGQWYRLGIEMNETPGVFNYYVDGVLVGTIFRNLSGYKMTVSAAMWNRVTATMTVPHQLDIDYCYIETPGQTIDTLYL